MWEHPAWRDFEKTRAAEEARIKCIANPAERARRLAYFDMWAKEQAENISVLIGIEESRTATDCWIKEHDYA